MSNNSETEGYIGRFAPSPSGPLHLGSLTTAIGSYLDAKLNRGLWLLRIDNIDPPREPKGTISTILNQLESYGLTWDRTEIYQSDRDVQYQEALCHLKEQGIIYYCDCTRARLKPFDIYPGFCRSHKNEQSNTAIRVNLDSSLIQFQDQLQGIQTTTSDTEIGDFVLKRKDGLWAYQLATALDDTQDGITHVVRGIDLLDSSFRQIWLHQRWGKKSPFYAHLPVIATQPGSKLSKQNHAPAITLDQRHQNLLQAFKLLGLPTPPEMDSKDLLNWAIAHWQPERLKNTKEIII